MTRRAGTTLFVLSFTLVPWGLEACGRAANVLEGVPADPFDGSDSPGGAGGFGGAGTGGTGRTGGSKAANGVRVPLGTGGILGPGGGPATGGIPSAGGGPGTLTNAETLRMVVDRLCTLTAKFPCLSLEVSGAPSGATLEQKQELCRQATVRSYESTIGDHCFTEWYENAVCAVGYTGYCPCTPDAGQACSLSPETHDYGPPCAVGAFKLAFCARSAPSGVAEGGVDTYEWVDDGSGGVATDLARDGIDRIESVCSGSAPGKPRQ